MHCDVYTMDDDLVRLSFKEVANQVALGLDVLLPTPHFDLVSFEDQTGRLIFDLGRGGTVLSNTKNVLKLGREMRATASGPSLGILVNSKQTLQRVAVLKIQPQRFELILPRNYYRVKSDNLFAHAHA